MKTRCGIPFVSILFAIVLGSAAAANGGVFSMGASFGATFTQPEYGDGATFIGIPGNAAEGLMPGLRLGLSDDTLRSAFAIDVGLGHASSGGASETLLIGAMSTTYAFSRERTSPYFTLGAGVLHTAYSSDGAFGHSDSATNPMAGVGIGVRSLVADEHGQFRAETRYDRIFPSGGDSTGMFSLRIGFDLFFS